MSDIPKDSRLQSLQIQRFIRATPERVFRAWTDPEDLLQWWGPTGVRCVAAEIELSVGGLYRIANEMPDGSILWISGRFEHVEAPHELTYTWVVENNAPETERVSVRFQAHRHGTKVTINHERIPTADLREQHELGWIGCLAGLKTHFDG